MSRAERGRTSAPVTRKLFDPKLRALRRDRAARLGPELFLLDRAFDECLDRLQDVARPFRRTMLIGCPDPAWAERVRRFSDKVETFDPGPVFAKAAGGEAVEEDMFDFGIARFDLCIAMGTLDTVDNLPFALTLIHRALVPDSLLIGAMAGGNSLPLLRSSLIEAERESGRVTARTHPRIEASSLAGLLSAAGFDMPVVDVDRVTLRYSALRALVQDLRAMGATNVLRQRPPGLTKDAVMRAEAAFAAAAIDGKSSEIVEILHFAGWSQQSGQPVN